MTEGEPSAEPDPRSDLEMSRISTERRRALPTDLAQDPLVLGRRHEPEPVGTRGGPDACERVQDGPVRVRLPSPATGRRPARPDLVERLVHVLREQQPHLGRVALELAVRERALLEGPEPFRSVVRLTEDSQPEQADGHHQHGSADERDEQLDVDLAGRRPTARATALSPQLSGCRLPVTASLSLPLCRSFRQELRA